MTKNDFIKDLLECCDLTISNPTGETLLQEIEGYDSLAIMTMIAYIDENFGVKLTGKDFSELTTIDSLIEKIESVK